MNTVILNPGYWHQVHYWLSVIDLADVRKTRSPVFQVPLSRSRRSINQHTLSIRLYPAVFERSAYCVPAETPLHTGRLEGYSIAHGCFGLHGAFFSMT